MKEELMQYAAMAKFLNDALGERFTVTLVDADDLTHDWRAEDRMLNKEAQNRPEVQRLLEDILDSEELSRRDYLCTYAETGNMGAGNALSVYYIRGEEKLSGFLCIEEKTGDRITVREVMDNLLGPISDEQEPQTNASKRIGEEVDSLLKEKISEVWLRYNKPGERLKKADKVAFILELMELGVFRIKGAAVQVSEVTGMSQASIYRYLSEAVEE